MTRFKELILKIVEISKKEEMRILPGNLAFFLFLSLIPIITLIGVFASMFSISVDSMISFMNETMPKNVSDILIPFIDGRGFDVNVGLFMILGFFVASNGAQSIIVASNKLYELEGANYLTRRIKALILTIIIVLLFIFIIVVLAFGNNIIDYILDIGFIKNLNTNFFQIYYLFKWPLSFLLIFIMMKLIYTITPDKKISSKYVTSGAVFTTLGWMGLTSVYSYYVNNFANYDIFYGGLSNIIIMMIWTYLLAYIFVLGIAINAGNRALKEGIKTTK